MPQKPLDATSRKFATVRFREGYDRTQVDGFLTEANGEIQRLARENLSLRARLDSATVPPPRVTEDVLPKTVDAPSALLASAERQHTEFMAFAQAEREKLIREADEKAQALVKDAERVRDETMKDLEQQRLQLEETTNQLRKFESEHRISMKTLMQEELDELAAGAEE